MSWTTPADIRAQLQKLWDKGALPASLVSGETFFPRRLSLKGPSSAELAERFAEARDWIARLEAAAGLYRMVWRDVNHRVLGANSLPAEIWIDSPDDALALIGKRREAERLIGLKALLLERQPELISWLEKKPLKALALAKDWPRLLDVVAWMRHNQRSGIYLRQVDIPGVHSKFIESHRAVLAELCDLALPPEAIDSTAGGASGFCSRYGFKEKPLRTRFRLLDASLALFETGTDQDITLTHSTFARLSLPVKRVFITENEINFLAFPAAKESMVIFGAGYGFEMLTDVDWLPECDIQYWGDIDTHGFAILDQLRVHLPQAASFLMDRATLLAHQAHWSGEPQPQTRALERLTGEEAALYDDLRQDRLGRQVRLEQEKIGFDWVRKALVSL